MNVLESQHNMRSYRGFSLIELMVTVAIVAVLAGIAYPSYRNYTLRVHRTDATTNLFQAAQILQRCYSMYFTYSSSSSSSSSGSSSSGASSSSAGCVLNSNTAPYPTPSGYYSISVDFSTPPNGFTLKATAIGNQVTDSQCNSFKLNNFGVQTAYNTAGTETTTTCWPAR